MTAATLELRDEPRRDETDRYALYVVNPKAPLTDHAGTGENHCRRRVYETCLEGIGQGIRMLYDEEEIPRGWRIGVFDRAERFWLVSPYA